jgi:hypothetical protein
LLRLSIGKALKDHKLCQLSNGEKGFRDHNYLNKYKKVLQHIKYDMF